MSRRSDNGLSRMRRVELPVAAGARGLGLRTDDVVVAGVSGGPDSIALLLSLLSASRRLGFGMHIAHLIHDPPGVNSHADAEFVRKVSRDRGIACSIEEVDVPAHQRKRGVGSFEQAARELRYGFLARVARRVGAKTVAMGHTADDQAETVLMRIARGSGLHGLRGMNQVNLWPYPEGDDPPQLWRPLLRLRRADTIAYCEAYRIPFRDDPTNSSLNMARNRVRLNLIPALAEQLNPQVSDALTRLSRTVSSQVDYMDEQAAAHWPAVAPNPAGHDGTLRLDRNALSEAHPALQPLLLRRAWVEIAGDSRRLTEQHLRDMTRMGSGTRSGTTIMLPGGYQARTRGRWLEMSRAGVTDDCPYPALSGEFRLTLPMGPIAVAVTKRDGWQVTTQAVRLSSDSPLDSGDPLAAHLSPAALMEGATVRTWQPGDRIQPLGMSGTRKLQDVFTDAGVPRGWRERIPMVVTPRGIAWVVGVRMAQWAALPTVDGQERPAVHVTFETLAGWSPDG